MDVVKGLRPSKYGIPEEVDIEGEKQRLVKVYAQRVAEGKPLFVDPPPPPNLN